MIECVIIALIRQDSVADQAVAGGIHDKSCRGAGDADQIDGDRH